MSSTDHNPPQCSFVQFTEEFTEAKWQAARASKNWPNGIDWHGIVSIGRNYWDAQATRAMWVKTLRGKQPTKQRKKVCDACVLMRQLEKALAALADDGLIDADFPHPDLNSAGQRLDAWLSDYDIWIQPFAGKSDPIQAELEWQLIHLWKNAGGKLAYSRKKERAQSIRRASTGRDAKARERQGLADADSPNTPYAPLVEFLKFTLSAILGKTYRPSGIAKMIDRHRGRRGELHPYRVHMMRLRIAGHI